MVNLEGTMSVRVLTTLAVIGLIACGEGLSSAPAEQTNELGLGANLALGATVTATSTAPGSSPAAAIDGNVGTGWIASPLATGTHAIKVNWGVLKPVGRIAVKFKSDGGVGAYIAHAFTLQYWNGSSWATLRSFSGNTRLAVTYDLPIPKSLASVRVSISSSGGFPSVAELQVYAPVTGGAYGTPFDPRGVEGLCDSSWENCEQPIIDLINRETTIVYASSLYWGSARIAEAMVARAAAGVEVRALVDQLSVNNGEPGIRVLLNAGGLVKLRMLNRAAGSRNNSNHAKIFVFGSQGRAHMGSANFDTPVLVPPAPRTASSPTYYDENLFFTSDPEFVDAMKTVLDDAWMNPNYVSHLPRGFIPKRFWSTRPGISLQVAVGGLDEADPITSQLLASINAETQGIDCIELRLSSDKLVSAAIARFNAGVPVRFITEPKNYNTLSTKNAAHKANVDRLLSAGVPVVERAPFKRGGLVHEKVCVFKGQRQVIFGSGNWDLPCGTGQPLRCIFDVNYLTARPNLFNWFKAQFDDKWNGAVGGSSHYTGQFVRF